MPYENLREYDNDDMTNGAAWGGVIFSIVMLVTGGIAALIHFM